MSALVVMAVLAAGPCFELKEPTAGWKRVELPGETSRLAAVDEVPQFRSGERVMLCDDANQRLQVTREAVSSSASASVVTVKVAVARRWAHEAGLSITEPLRLSGRAKYVRIETAVASQHYSRSMIRCRAFRAGNSHIRFGHAEGRPFPSIINQVTNSPCTAWIRTSVAGFQTIFVL